MRITRAAALIGLVALLAACQSTTPAGDDISVGDGPIRIGTAGPMFGEFSAFGQQLVAGSGLAVDDLNAAGGVLGRPIELLIGDDACDPRQAVSVANEMVADGIVFMAGHFCSDASIPASEVYTDANILQISPGSTNPGLTVIGGDNVFRVVGRDDDQGEIAGTLIADTYPTATIAVLHDGSPYGQYLSQATMATLAQRGIPVALFDSFQQGFTDIGPLTAELDRRNVDVLYVGGYDRDVGRIASALGRQGMDVQLISGDAVASTTFGTIAGPAGDGTLMTFFPGPADLPGGADVLRRLEANAPGAPGFELYAYAAVEVWAEAVERAGTTNTDALIAELRRGAFDTVVGRLTFDDNGDIEQPGYVWYRWQGGDYRPIN